MFWYKIRHKKTGLYYTGFAREGKTQWSTEGKTWYKLLYVQNVFHHKRTDVSDWEVMEFLVDPVHTRTLSPAEIIAEVSKEGKKNKVDEREELRRRLEIHQKMIENLIKAENPEELMRIKAEVDEALMKGAK